MNKHSDILGKKSKVKSVDLGFLALNEKDFRCVDIVICTKNNIPTK